MPINMPSADLEDTSPFFLEEHKMLRDQVRRFVEAEIKPFAEQWEEDGETPRSLLRRMGELGLFGMTYPAEFGGSDLDVRATVILAEELGRCTFGGVAITALVHTDMASVHVAHVGTSEQKQRWMRRIISGDLICAVAITEPDAGSDVKAIRTRAVRDDDAYVVNGQKTFITNGVNADLVCVAVKTGVDQPASRALSMLAVERGTPGFFVSRKLDKHGWRSSDTAELVFDDCRVPAANLLGEEGHAFYAIMRNFQNERIVLAAMALGEALAALEVTIRYVKDRQAFGQPLWEKQVIRHRLAALRARVEANRCHLHTTAWRMARGLESTRDVSMLKATCGELVNEVMYDCVQFHGGMGFIRGTVIERMSRDARVQAIGGGATEVMLEEVAKRL